MNDKPLVSIMIPVFNQGKYISRAIESVLNQDYDNIEIVIGDDCSEDNTSAIILSYLLNPKIKYFKNETRLGRVKNYHNLLYEKASGEWVANLDGDDFYTDYNFISECIKHINNDKSKSICMIQAGHTLLFEHSNTKQIKVPNIKNEFEIIDGKEYLYNFIKINHFSHLATLYNRKKAIDINFYNEGILSTDMESILRLASTGNIILIKKSVGVWLQHELNISSNSGFNKLIENLVWIDNVGEFVKKSDKNHSKWNKWIKSNYKIQLTGIMKFESEKANFSHKIKLLLYFWRNYRFIFLYPVFIKKMGEILIKKKK